MFFPCTVRQFIGRDFLLQCKEICRDKCLDDCRHKEVPKYLMTVASGDGEYSSLSQRVGTTVAD